MSGEVTASLTATGQTDKLPVDAHTPVSVSATGVSPNTVQLQWSFDDGSTWVSVEEFTADAAKNYQPASNHHIRLAVTAHTSGTVALRLRRG